MAKRGIGSLKGRIALIHSLCHIELNAIDLALDIVARFANVQVPRSFFDGWMMVAAEEAKHFTLLRNRLHSLGADYGDLPAHDGLWEAAQETDHDLTARLALVPLVLEARGPRRHPFPFGRAGAWGRRGNRGHPADHLRG